MADETREITGRALSHLTLSDVTLRECELNGVRLTGAVISDVEVDGLVAGLVVNGVDVGPLVAAELDRRHPERTLIRSDAVDELADGWDWLRAAWAETHGRIRGLSDAQAHERVHDEWSALETLRHLVFVHDVWFGAAVRGLAGVHAIGLAADMIPDPEQLGLDPGARPSVADVVNVRQQQLDEVERYLDSVTDSALLRPARAGVPAWDPRPRTIRDCLHVLFNEEWEHHRFCERDLASLTGGTAPAG